MADEKNRPKTPHHVILEDRSFLTVSGVSDIDSFNEETAVLFTELGELTIRGSDLHMNKLNVDTGEVTIEAQKTVCAVVSVAAARQGGRESFDRGQYPDNHFFAGDFDGGGIWSGI